MGHPIHPQFRAEHSAFTTGAAIGKYGMDPDLAALESHSRLGSNYATVPEASATSRVYLPQTSCLASDLVAASSTPHLPQAELQLVAVAHFGLCRGLEVPIKRVALVAASLAREVVARQQAHYLHC